MAMKNQKVLVLMAGVMLFSTLGLSAVYAQTMSGSGYGGLGAGQGQAGNFTSHGSHGGSFSHSGNFTRNAGAYNMTSHSGNFTRNGATNMASSGMNQQFNRTSIPAASNVPSVPTTPGIANTSSSTNNALPPLQQFRSGIAASSVVCQGNFQLILKSEDGSPACVDSGTFAILVERGWGHSP